MFDLVFLLVISFIVMGIGIYGLISERNIIKILLSIEVIFLGAIMAVAFLSLISPSPPLTRFVVMIIALIAALEEAVGLGIAYMMVRITKKLNVDELRELSG